MKTTFCLKQNDGNFVFLCGLIQITEGARGIGLAPMPRVLAKVSHKSSECDAIAYIEVHIYIL